jgi:hypothetical protein
VSIGTAVVANHATATGIDHSLCQAKRARRRDQRPISSAPSWSASHIDFDADSTAQEEDTRDGTTCGIANTRTTTIESLLLLLLLLLLLIAMMTMIEPHIF